ncbi:MAG: hypothetical protein PHV06_00195 [bacterium]|nr:hypothetical protein [bacterium]
MTRKINLFIFILILTFTIQTTAEISEEKLEELFKTASLWEVGDNKELVQNARNELISIGQPAYEFIINKKLGSNDSLQFRALEAVIPAKPAIAIPLLRNVLKDEKQNPASRKDAIYFLGKLQDSEEKDYILALFNNRDYQSAVVNYSKQLKISEIEPLVIKELPELTEPRAISYIDVLGEIGTDASVEFLINYLQSDRNMILRTAAENSLMRLIKSGNYEMFITSLQKTKSDQLKYHLITIIASTNNPDLEDILIEQLNDKNWIIRYLTVKKLKEFSPSQKISNALEQLKAKENNPIILSFLET